MAAPLDQENRMHSRYCLIVTCLLLGGFLGSAPASAHHSRANFDLDREIEITGTVVRWQYKNPHSYLHLDVPTREGGTERWVVELGSIPNLKQMGMDRDTLKPGETVVIQANPERNAERKYAFFRSMTVADGTRYAFQDVFDYSQRARDTARDHASSMDLTGKWDERVSPQALLVGSGLPEYPASEEGRRVLAGYDPADDPWFTCHSSGLPSLIGTPYVTEIARAGDDYVFNYEFPATTRTIHMDPGAHPDDLEPSVFGHSIGHVEGEVLIVDTTGFVATRWGIGEGLDSSPQKHVIERYRLIEDGYAMEISYTVTDPVYLAAPYSRTHIKDLVPDYELTESEECDPEAAGLHLKLEKE